MVKIFIISGIYMLKCFSEVLLFGEVSNFLTVSFLRRVFRPVSDAVTTACLAGRCFCLLRQSLVLGGGDPSLFLKNAGEVVYVVNATFRGYFAYGPVLRGEDLFCMVEFYL